MKRFAVIMVVLAGLFASPTIARAQTSQSPAQSPTNADAIRQMYNTVKNNLLKAADKMPDDGYAFQPTPDERAFGGWIAHVADAQTGGCSRALGTPKTPSAGSKTTKADLVAALKDSFETCDAAYAALTDANANDPIQSFRGPTPRLAALAGNVAHDNECYGAIAVYLRLKGIVPPSTEGQRQPH
jgi:DinB superfamily